MNKFKTTCFKQCTIAYLVIISFIYLAGYAYWQKRGQDYWLCRAVDGPTLNSDGCGIKPDGPMGVMLFIVIPFAMTILFILVALTYYHFQKRKFNKTGQNQGEL